MQTNSQKASYSMGYKMGFDLSHQFGEIELELLLQGVADAVRRQNPALSQMEMAGIIANLMAYTQQRAAEHMAKQVQDQDEFFRKNGSKHGIKYLKDGIQYKVLKEGSGEKAFYPQTISMHYRTSLLNGTLIAESYTKNIPQEVKIREVMPGLAKALIEMKVGDKWKIFIPSEQAYGHSGRPPFIPPHSALIYEVELLQVFKEG